MNKLNAGDYVRTKKGKITRIANVWENERIFFEDFIDIDYCNTGNITNDLIDKYIIKSSPNIIDLIEVGDYVNGFYVFDKPFNQRIHTEFDDFFEEDIKSIVTKEQFENISYKVGE